MNHTSTQQLIQALSWRYAVKKFDASRKIPPDVWAALESAAVLSPSSYGLQPWKFVVVGDPQTRATLRAASWNQSQITDASHLIVFARKLTTDAADAERLVARIRQVRGSTAEEVEPYRQMMLGFVNNLPAGFNASEWNARQVYIALGFFLASAALLGVDACPMEGFDPAVYDRTLGLPEMGYAATVVATAGYRAQDDFLAPLAKVRYSHEDLIIRR
ncbi:MAG: NAD(P)H-dependent oxidoreductase [Phycisphaeraceae bacterium]|nr:NAD(P)H-dependent oxidoreductase [Phycisphaeraceae bacterium]